MRTLDLNPFENVGASQTAVVPRIPLGETYHGLLLELGGTTMADSNISNIKLRLGGKVFFDISGSHMQTINKYLGSTSDNSYLLLPFFEPNARTIQGEAIGSIDTSLGYSNFSAEVSIDGSASAPTLKGHAMTTPVKVFTDPGHQPMIRALIKSVHTPAASGTFNLPIPLGSQAGALIKRVHLFHSNVTQFDVKMNGIDLQDRGTNGPIQFLQNYLTRTTQSGHLCWDPLWRDNQSEAVPTLSKLPSGQTVQNSFVFNVTVSASDTITAYTELYTTLNAL